MLSIMSYKTLILSFSLLILTITSVACSYKPVKPWERHLLAQDMAQLVPDSLEAEVDEHIYFSKEAASGGQGIGGGGCGCN